MTADWPVTRGNVNDSRWGEGEGEEVAKRVILSGLTTTIGVDDDGSMLRGCRTDSGGDWQSRLASVIIIIVVVAAALLDGSLQYLWLNYVMYFAGCAVAR